MIGLGLYFKDLLLIIKWYLGFVVLGASVLPLCFYVFRNFRTKGYFASKLMGLIITSYLMWLLSSCRLMPFNAVCCYICIVLIVLAQLGVMAIIEKKRSIPYFSLLIEVKNVIKSKIGSIFTTEICFLFLLAISNWLFGHRIQAESTERIMDLGIMKMLDITAYMPPKDMWSVSGPLNYYYFGHYIMTFLCKLCGIDVAYGYTFALCSIMAIALIMVFIIVYELLAIKHNKLLAVIGGVCSSIMVNLSGSMHYVFYYLINSKFGWKMPFPNEKESYWFADTSRFIGYNPLNEADRTIHEFPFYSYLVGDLHAHVIDIIVVQTILVVMLAMILNFQKRDTENKVSFIGDLLNQELIIGAILVGICSMTNYWDYPIYFIVCGSIVLVMNINMYLDKPERALGLTAVQGCLFMVIVLFVNLPFRLKFDKMESGISLCTTSTPFYQFMILWGIPLIVLGFFIVFLANTLNSNNFTYEKYKEDIYVLLIGLCGAGLTIVPEVIYIKDIYENGFPRANSMFKMTYQAYILLGMVIGYAIIRIWSFKLKDIRGIKNIIIRFLKLILIPIAVCLFLCCGYSITSVNQWMGNPIKGEYFGADSFSKVKEELGAEMGAYDWVKENVDSDSIVLQVNGDSYTAADTLSVYTGCSTVLGWGTHEWLWHNSYDYIYNLGNEIKDIYTNPDPAVIKQKLMDHKVDYVYIGQKEYEKYPDINIDGLLQNGRLVYSFDLIDTNNRNMIIEVIN